jgi:hypothetical protein
MAPSLDQLEARQLLSAAPVHVHAEPLHQHRAAAVRMARHAHHATARISVAASPLAAVQGLHVVSSPQFAGGLVATAAIADKDIWAIGFQIQTIAPTAPPLPPLAEHFDGTRWRVVPTPTLSSGGINPPFANFFGVAAAGTNDVWAVGNKIGPDNPDFGEQLIEHWNGKSWSVDTTGPEIEDDSLSGVTVVASNNVWAVGAAGGNALVEHWDGTRWSIVSNSVIAGAGRLSAVSADSANDVWAVGQAGNGGPPILHFNGTTWSRVAAPIPSLEANSVTALSPTNVWAVGTVQTFFNHRSHTKAAIEHWDGTSWSIVSSPSPTSSLGLDSSLRGIAAISANDIWAVGTFNKSTGGAATLTEHWDGMSWTIISSPNPGTASNSLFGVTALSDGTVVAVGSQTNQGTDATALILHS